MGSRHPSSSPHPALPQAGVQLAPHPDPGAHAPLHPSPLPQMTPTQAGAQVTLPALRVKLVVERNREQDIADASVGRLVDELRERLATVC